jgi:thioredoxin reductase (NADPH)
MELNAEKVKCLIIGSGPAGYTAAIYTSRADLKPVLYQGIQPGGQLTITSDIENFPGYPEGISGYEMMEDMRKQAEKYGTDNRFGIVTKVDFTERPFKITIDDEKLIIAETVIIATGATARWLEIPSEAHFKGFGVSTCATCDGFFYKGKNVAVVGGGDTAAEEASYLSNLCKKVYIIHRRDEFRASKAMQNKIFHSPNIEIVYDSIVQEIVGEQVVQGVIVKNKITSEEKRIDVDGVFIAIGHTPNTEVFKGQIEINAEGYIITQPGTSKTNIPGVFAAGDVRDLHYKQAVTAAAWGCIAAIDAERYLNEICGQ